MRWLSDDRESRLASFALVVNGQVLSSLLEEYLTRKLFSREKRDNSRLQRGQLEQTRALRGQKGQLEQALVALDPNYHAPWNHAFLLQYYILLQFGLSYHILLPV